jgi:hypothetical protein
VLKKIAFLFFVTTVLIFADIGRIAVKKGDVSVIRGGYSLTATTGMSLKEGDLIKTSQNGKVQLILEDKTVITIGKKSEFAINNYFFKKGNKNSKSNFKLRKGIFKSITGKIGKIAPNRFKIKTRTSTIGIRGTQMIVTSDEFKDEIACLEGGLYVQANGENFNIDAGNYMTVLNESSPDLPKQLTEEVLNNFRQALKVSSINRSSGSSTSVDANKQNNKKLSPAQQREQQQSKKQKSMDTQMNNLSMTNSSSMSNDFGDILQFNIESDTQMALEEKAEDFGFDIINNYQNDSFKEAFDPDASSF